MEYAFHISRLQLVGQRNLKMEPTSAQPTEGQRPAIIADLQARPSGWLREATTTAKAAVQRDFESWDAASRVA